MVQMVGPERCARHLIHLYSTGGAGHRLFHACMEPPELNIRAHAIPPVHGLGRPWNHPAYWWYARVSQGPCAAMHIWDTRDLMPMRWFPGGPM